MKAILLSILLLCIGAHMVGAQAKIEKLWGNKGYDGAFSAAATSDGGYIISGLSQSGDEKIGDIIIIKTNVHADTMWTLRVGGPNLEGGNYIMETSDGGFMVSGHTEDFGASDCDAFLLKLDKAGHQQWLKVYGGEHDDISEGAVELPGEGYVFSGITENYGFAQGVAHGQDSTRNIYFVKTNLSGDTIWTKAYGGPGKEYAYSIARLHSGGFLSAGFSNSWSNGIDNAWLLRLKDDGDTLWTRMYHTAGGSRFFQVLPLKDGGYILAGYTHLSSTDQSRGFAVRLDKDGQELWQKTYGSSTDDINFHGVAEYPNGNLIFSGMSHKQDPQGNAYVVTTTPSGEVISDRYFGSSNAFSNAIAIQGNYSFLIAGQSFRQGDPDGDLYFMEQDATIAGIPETHATMPTVFPVPSRNQLTIILPSTLANQSTTLTITDTRGSIITTQQNEPGKDITINCKSIPTGIYNYRILSQRGNILTGKFTIE